VLIENMKPNALAKRGFGADKIAEINPRTIYCAISGFGAHSRYPGRPAFDTVVQAMSGLMHLIRAPDGAPMKTGISIADVMGAAVAVVAVLAALEERDRSGKGQGIDLSMQDIMAWVTQVAWNRSDVAHDSHILRVADGHVVVAGAKEVVLQADIEDLSRADVVSLLCGAGYRAVPVVRPAEVLQSEQTAARSLCFRLADERGEWPSLGVPMRLTRTPPQIDRPSPALGRDTAEVLGELSAGTAVASTVNNTTLHAPHPEELSQ
jgi:crotonobetainyl-CoA:carnitine CoA-transferase CaiB-like acyl-CoA transferase